MTTIYLIYKTTYTYNDYSGLMERSSSVESDPGYYTDRSEAEKVAEELNAPLKQRYERTQEQRRKENRREAANVTRINKNKAILREAGRRVSADLKKPVFRPQTFDEWLDMYVSEWAEYSVTEVDPA